MEELDYEREAANASYVARQLESLEGVVVPKPVASLSTRSVLVVDWIEGERLSESTADDVLTLCTTLLNAYLVQLLEIGEVTGRLHGDAHEGNLLRTTDGRVAILDWGLVQEIPPHISLALVEYIAHLSVGDWEGVCGDLAKLGFVPPGAPDPVEAGLAPALGAVLEQLSSGGGAKGVDVAAIQGEIEILSSKLALQIPSYFALILRTFSLIEGIALKVRKETAGGGEREREKERGCCYFFSSFLFSEFSFSLLVLTLSLLFLSFFSLPSTPFDRPTPPTPSSPRSFPTSPEGSSRTTTPGPARPSSRCSLAPRAAPGSTSRGCASWRAAFRTTAPTGSSRPEEEEARGLLLRWLSPTPEPPLLFRRRRRQHQQPPQPAEEESTRP